MFIHCTACNQSTDASIDKRTGQVVCNTCGRETEVSPFAKAAMRENRDFVERNKGSFEFQCNACKTVESAVLRRQTNEVICTRCGTAMQHVSPFMANVMRAAGRFERKTASNDHTATDDTDTD